MRPDNPRGLGAIYRAWNPRNRRFKSCQPHHNNSVIQSTRKSGLEGNGFDGASSALRPAGSEGERKTGSLTVEDFRVLGCLERNGNLREWRTVGLGCQSVVGVYYRD